MLVAKLGYPYQMHDILKKLKENWQLWLTMIYFMEMYVPPPPKKSECRKINEEGEKVDS